jgi:hypothetical protein
MSLPHEDVDEVDAIAEALVQLLERLDRADGDRSTVGAEAQQHGPVEVLREAPRGAADLGQFEVGREDARLHADARDGFRSIGEEMCRAEMRVVVLVGSHAHG